MDSFGSLTPSSISCSHDPDFNIMEVCKFCNNDICSSCRIVYKPKINNTKTKTTKTPILRATTAPALTLSSTVGAHTPYIDIYTSNIQLNIEIEKYQCKPCTIENEYQNMSSAILSALHSPNSIFNINNTKTFEINIINILTSYAVGYVIKCCNTDKQCDSEISISNRFDLENKSLDSDNNKILNTKYGITTPNNNNVEIYGQNRKIFCKQCMNATDNKVKTPFMMMMNTQRFHKNCFGVEYEIM
eukprot:127346_1